MNRPYLEVSSVVLGARDADELASFYERLLGWTRVVDDGDWVMLREPGGALPRLSFQAEADHIPPVWPARPGEQQMMLHLDIGAVDMTAAIELAVAAGATVADHQPQDDVRVLLDPAGHPFCLFPIPGPA